MSEPQHERPEDAADVEEMYALCRDEIERRMHAAAWTKGKSGRALAGRILDRYVELHADEWRRLDNWTDDEKLRFRRVHAWVRKCAAEASRNVRRTVTDPDHVVSTISTTMERMLRTAYRSGDAKLWGSAVQAARLWADLAGVLAPTKHEVTGAGGAPLGLPANVAAVWDKAVAGDADAVAIVERYARTGEGPGLDLGQGERPSGAVGE